jgi:DHA1 family multidrug resistance protein-like MFS transporter
MQLIYPLFPLYLNELGASEIQNAAVISIGGLAATPMMLVSGFLSDKIGKKVIIFISIIIRAGSIYLLSTVNNWFSVIPFYIFYSISMALFIPTRMAIISENTTPNNRASVFGIMNLAMPISGIVTPVISGLIVENLGWKSVFILATFVSITSSIPAFLMKGFGKSKSDLIRREKTSKSSLFDREYLSTLFLFFFFELSMSAGIGSVNMILPLYLDRVFNLSPSRIGLFFTGNSFITLITQTPSGYLADRFNKKKLVISCLALIPLFYGLSIFVKNWVILLILFSVVFGLWSMTWPAVAALLADSVPNELLGSAFGVRMTGVRLGFTMGPIIGSYLFSNLFYTAPFLAAALFFTLSISLAFRLKETKDT